MKIDEGIKVIPPRWRVDLALARWFADVSTHLRNLGPVETIVSSAVSIDFASIAANAEDKQTVTVEGAQLGGIVLVEVPTNVQAGIVFDGYVSATDQVTVRALNAAATVRDPPSTTYRVTVINHEQ